MAPTKTLTQLCLLQHLLVGLVVHGARARSHIVATLVSNVNSIHWGIGQSNISETGSDTRSFAGFIPYPNHIHRVTRGPNDAASFPAIRRQWDDDIFMPEDLVERLLARRVMQDLLSAESTPTSVSVEIKYLIDGFATDDTLLHAYGVLYSGKLRSMFQWGRTSRRPTNVSPSAVHQPGGAPSVRPGDGESKQGGSNDSSKPGGSGGSRSSSSSSSSNPGSSFSGRCSDNWNDAGVDWDW